MKKIIKLILAVFFVLSLFSCSSKKIIEVTDKESVIDVQTYGFVDLEGSKLSYIAIHYKIPLYRKSITNDTYTIKDFTVNQEEQNSFDNVIERDWDNIKGNEGQIQKVYVTDNPYSLKGFPEEKSKGNYVIIKVNTDYMMSLSNLSFIQTMIADVIQVKDITSGNTLIKTDNTHFSNYTSQELENPFSHKTETFLMANTDTIHFAEFDPSTGWKINTIGNGAFKAAGCYSEYTGKYYDFELPYAIYVPSKKILEANKGKVSLVLHIEHAGACDTDPLASLTSSKAAVKLSSDAIQKENPSIIIVPQIEESRRGTDDFVASSEANPAIWQLLDSIITQYGEYIDQNRIYGSGQSMGGMTILYMASQRDNFFAGISAMGSQWSNNYNKDIQHNGSPARNPSNDTVSFNGFGLDKDNYQNWYYMISDDNILVHTCIEDPMATEEWKYTEEYFENAGVKIPHIMLDPYLSVKEQNITEEELINHDNTKPGSGINIVTFTKGSHMSTWRYGYQIDEPYVWLFNQTRQTEVQRGKVDQLSNEWLGRSSDNKLLSDSGTKNMNSAQFTPHGASNIYKEGWTLESTVNK